MASINAEFLHLDGTKVVERIIGIGGTGIVVQQGQYALKIPRISRDTESDGVLVTNRRLTPEEGDYDERPDLIRSIEDEKAIYRRLGDHHGIVRCYNSSSIHHSIQMALMNKGDLRHYLAETRPGKRMQLSWLAEMAHTMAYIHNRRVIIADIRLDNLLLDDDLAVKFADFGESTLMPRDWNLDGSDDLGYSILTDIGQFGAVMFEIVTGQSCKFDIMQDWKEVGDLSMWPRRDSLPSTNDVWLGWIVEKCWTRGFRSANDLAAELNNQVHRLHTSEGSAGLGPGRRSSWRDNQQPNGCITERLARAYSQ
ncbi:hypothetical protein GJ744_005058 [Endocarpon pusillum]|uniref:Protein kinase domain-containing protein n=1 Tax=Endocarpon pusillum TaxID=364733 RepID=A0A8H7AQF5_9EURO|nr:hypothetical protein GJ744_005058 [Endocarpon pusillum]